MVWESVGAAYGHPVAGLDEIADRAWDAMDEARGTAEFSRLRDIAFAAKDRADDAARQRDRSSGEVESA